MNNSLEDSTTTPTASGSKAPLGELQNELLLHLFGEGGLASLRAEQLEVHYRDRAGVRLHRRRVHGVWAFRLHPSRGVRYRQCRIGFADRAAHQNCQRRAEFPAFSPLFWSLLSALSPSPKRLFAAEDVGVAAKFIPGIPEIQTKLAEILGIQKTTLTTVNDIKSDTADLKRQVAQLRSLVRQLLDKQSQTSPELAAAPDTKERLTQTVANNRSRRGNRPALRTGARATQGGKAQRGGTLTESSCRGRREASREGCQGGGSSLSKLSFDCGCVRSRPRARLLREGGATRSNGYPRHVGQRRIPKGRRTTRRRASGLRKRDHDGKTGDRR